MTMPPNPETPTGQKKVRRRGIYILPNLFTTATLFAAFYAVIRAIHGDFSVAAIAILIALVMDGLDGRVARLTNTASDFGKEYDSLADVVAFGLTPALVVYQWALFGFGKIGWLCAFLYVSTTALRLARFNVQPAKDKRYFQGLPCPAAAAVIATFVWLGTDIDWSDKTMGWFALVLTVSSGLAMVSNLRYRSFKEFDARGKVPFMALIVLVFVFMLISFDPPVVLFMLSFGYLASGPAVTLLGIRKTRANRAKEE